MHRILLIWLLSSAAPASAAQWRFVTEDFPPFTYPADAPVSETAGVAAAGPFVEVVNSICARLQHQCTIELYPWQRAYRLAEQGLADGIFTLTPSPQREQMFHISRMLVTSRYSVFAQAKKAASSSINQLMWRDGWLAFMARPAPLMCCPSASSGCLTYACT